MAINPVYSPAPSATQQAPGQTSTATQAENRAASGANAAPGGTAGC